MHYLLITLLLILTACRAAAPSTATQAPGTPAPFALTNTPILHNRPFVMPTAPPAPTPICPNTQRHRLTPGERGRVSNDDPTPVNMRAGPQTTFELVGQIPVSAVFYVVDGPECSERYTWFHVRYHNLDGWIAEGDRDRYFVEPYPPG